MSLHGRRRLIGALLALLALDRAEGEALQRALVHVLDDPRDEREQLARRRGRRALERRAAPRGSHARPRRPEKSRAPALHRLDALHVDRRELDEHVVGQAEPLELGDRAQDVEVGGVVRVAPELDGDPGAGPASRSRSASAADPPLRSTSSSSE